MNAGSSAPKIDPTVEMLREEFDLSFQQPRAGSIVELESLLLVRIKEELLALRVSELGGLHECPALTRVPGRYKPQIGLGGLRSRLVAVYSLSAFVGRDRIPRAGRWIALCGADPSIGFAFDEIEGYVQVPKESLRSPSNSSEQQYAAGAVRIDAAMRPIVELSAVVDTIRLSLSEANS